MSLKKLLKDFKNNFKDDFNIQDALCWLEQDILDLIKTIIPSKITDKETAKEIKNHKPKLDDIGKQNTRAKNYGWNLCIEKTKSNINK